jgi:hypothetical protein
MSKKKAISTVLTTLIILMAAISLAIGVISYGSNLFRTTAQSTSMSVTGVQLWADKEGSGWAWGGAKIRNNGDTLVAVNAITIHGTNIPFENWYVDTSKGRVPANFQNELNYSSRGILYGATSVSGGMSNGTNDGLSTAGCTYDQTHLIIQLSPTTPNLCLFQATSPVPLLPSDEAIIYFKVPQNLLVLMDAGKSQDIQISSQKVAAIEIVIVQSK